MFNVSLSQKTFIVEPLVSKDTDSVKIKNAIRGFFDDMGIYVTVGAYDTEVAGEYGVYVTIDNDDVDIHTPYAIENAVKEVIG